MKHWIDTYLVVKHLLENIQAKPCTAHVLAYLPKTELWRKKNVVILGEVDTFS